MILKYTFVDNYLIKNDNIFFEKSEIISDHFDKTIFNYHFVKNPKLDIFLLNEYIEKNIKFDINFFKNFIDLNKK
jgi:hypothetical protein